MNPNPIPTLANLNPNLGITVFIHIDRKVFFQQRLVSLFGAERLGEIINSPHPFILPLINYHNSCNIYIFILI